MAKCGKGCMPECKYFTTGGCISPFNCQYKIETGYINSATSIPTYMEKQMSMTAEEIEHCLERFTMGKTTDVMNFDYEGTLAYIQRLKAENASLRERLENAIEVPFVFNKKVFVIVYDQKENPHLFEGIVTGIGTDTNKLYEGEIDLLMSVVDECGETYFINGKQYRKQWFCEDEIEYAEARLTELKGEEKDG